MAVTAQKEDTVAGDLGLMRQLEQQREAFDTDAVEAISDLIDAGDRVLVRYVWRVRGRGPGANVEMTAVCTVRKRSVIGIEYFWDHAEALKAVGLEE